MNTKTAPKSRSKLSAICLSRTGFVKKTEGREHGRSVKVKRTVYVFILGAFMLRQENIFKFFICFRMHCNIYRLSDYNDGLWKPREYMYITYILIVLNNTNIPKKLGGGEVYQ